MNPADDFDRELGARLQQMREERGLSFTEAGRLTGVDRSTLRKYESGERTLYSETLFRILAGYGRSLSDLDELVDLFEEGATLDDRTSGSDSPGRRLWVGIKTKKELDAVISELAEIRDEER